MVTAFDPRQTALFGFADLDGQRLVEQIAPIVAINGIKDPTVVIERFEDLAAALGANPSAPVVAAARAAYRKAIAGARVADSAWPATRRCRRARDVVLRLSREPGRT